MKTLTKHKTLRFADLPKTYNGLAMVCMPRPIHDTTQYDEVDRVVRELVGRDDLTDEQGEYLQAMAMFMEAYEEEHVPMRGREKTPVRALRYLMEQSGMTRADLGRLLGDSSLGTRVLNGERDLSKAHIKKLCDHFRVEPGYFLR